ncbi:small acid-soluble spore protein O [Alkalihalobacillus sp. AL-G]|nr:small acid-soluble spore protein O [Alkalihalobacillus sp. AL-G]WLD95273.1 small acid-soluble spore protein O [Alkalihalobacillus sp. AL-G]
MAKTKKSPQSSNLSDRQAVQQTSQFDHEFANDPLTETEKQNNKKRKKNQ